MAETKYQALVIKLRIHAVWQFCIYESDITRIFQIVGCVMTNLQKIRPYKILDFVPNQQFHDFEGSVMKSNCGKCRFWTYYPVLIG